MSEYIVCCRGNIKILLRERVYVYVCMCVHSILMSNIFLTVGQGQMFENHWLSGKYLIWSI